MHSLVSTEFGDDLSASLIQVDAEADELMDMDADADADEELDLEAEAEAEVDEELDAEENLDLDLDAEEELESEADAEVGGFFEQVTFSFCPIGYSVKRKANTPKTPPNGCGPESSKFLRRAGNHMFDGQVQKCCDAHDIAYDKCGASKLEADYQFYQCLQHATKAQVSRFIIPRSLYTAVAKGGDSPYSEAQELVCECRALVGKGTKPLKFATKRSETDVIPTKASITAVAAQLLASATAVAVNAAGTVAKKAGTMAANAILDRIGGNPARAISSGTTYRGSNFN